MRVYLGMAANADYDIITRLNELRDDTGVCVSAYYYKTMKAIRKNVDKLVQEEVPIFLDNGAVQTFRLGTNEIKSEYLRQICRDLNPDFLLAPDVLGDAQMTLDRQIRFIKENDDLELMAPLQNINYGPIFRNEIAEEIETLKDVGYKRFGFGRPYATKMNRTQAILYYSAMLKPHVPYLHFLGYPLGRGVAGTNHLDSCDVGTYSLMMKYRYQVYKNPEESAQILNNLINVEQTLRGIRSRQTMNKQRERI